MPSRCTTRVKLDAACRIGQGVWRSRTLGLLPFFRLPPYRQRRLSMAMQNHNSTPARYPCRRLSFKPTRLTARWTPARPSSSCRPQLVHEFRPVRRTSRPSRRGANPRRPRRAATGKTRCFGPGSSGPPKKACASSPRPGCPSCSNAGRQAPTAGRHGSSTSSGAPSRATSAPLLRCQYLHWSSPDRSVSALTFHHAIGDGRSGAELLRHLLDIMATDAAATPRAAIDPLPAMYEVFPHRCWSEQPDTADQVADRMMADYKRHGRVGRLPWLAGTELSATTRAPRFIRFTVPPEAVRRLLALSRQTPACTAYRAPRSCWHSTACRRADRRRPCSCPAPSICAPTSNRSSQPRRPVSMSP